MVKRHNQEENEQDKILRGNLRWYRFLTYVFGAISLSSVANLYLIEKNLYLIEKIKDETKGGLRAHFPQIITSETVDGLDEQIQHILSTPTLSAEEAKETVRQNICRINTFYMERDSYYIVANSEGTCLLLSDTLILTVNHVVNHEDLNLFYFPTYMVDAYGESYDAKPVAFSPLYDLALLQLEVEVSSPVQSVPIGMPERENGTSFFLYSVQGDEKEFSIEERILSFEEYQKSYLFNKTGLLLFPSIEVSPNLAPGYSGSPVLQSDGTLFGIISQNKDEEGISIVSPHVFDFLNCLARSDCSGWPEPDWVDR